MSIVDRHARIGDLICVSRAKVSRLIIFGLGAMGSPVVEHLVRHGVATQSPGQLTLADYDRVESPNLVRTGYFHSHIGLLKVDATESVLEAVDPNVRVSKISSRIAPTMIAELAERPVDLVCNFSGDETLSPLLEDTFYPKCPVIRAFFGAKCDVAQIAYSIPNQTLPISKTLGKRERQTLHGAEALGVDTAFVTSFVAALCLRLLTLGHESDVLPPVYSDAPMYVIGLRRSWIFKDMPLHQQRAIYLVGEPNE